MVRNLQQSAIRPNKGKTNKPITILPNERTLLHKTMKMIVQIKAKLNANVNLTAPIPCTPFRPPGPN